MERIYVGWSWVRIFLCYYYGKDPCKGVVYLTVLCEHPYLVFTFCHSVISPSCYIFNVRKNKKAETRHSFFSDIHLQGYELGGSTQKTIWQLCQVVVVEKPGEAETKQQYETVYCTHSKRQDWYVKSERTVHHAVTYRIQGAQEWMALVEMWTKSMFVTQWCHNFPHACKHIGIITRCYIWVRGVWIAYVDRVYDWKEPVSQATSCSASKTLLRS